MAETQLNTPVTLEGMKENMQRQEEEWDHAKSMGIQLSESQEQLYELWF